MLRSKRPLFFLGNYPGDGREPITEDDFRSEKVYRAPPVIDEVTRRPKVVFHLHEVVKVKHPITTRDPGGHVDSNVDTVVAPHRDESVDVVTREDIIPQSTGRSSKLENMGDSAMAEDDKRDREGSTHEDDTHKSSKIIYIERQSLDAASKKA
ncbi:hypothetical protein D9619_004353 [Psilocybe cf. subviscida]|uniref:Uncharacterized protein n=1 Tax=Psilocybe cf. subviscida TaxID=2480587 RepID=A0A8H5BQV4_9AGAR|nr:hypothetical protein D9619_004353 [Psilocybe cf. subviscida]